MSLKYEVTDMNPLPLQVEPVLELTDDEIFRVANCVRGLVIDAIEASQSGHPGAPLGLADIASVLFWDVMRYQPHHPDWCSRDRLVLSNGHASMLLYACLHMAGYDISLEDLKRFRQIGSKAAGHPEYGVCPGVETTTGPLGQGFANAVGMALAQRILASRFPPDERGFSPATGRVFVICSDGDLMEGISSEALQLAGAWELGNLVAIYDKNGVTIDGRTDLSWIEDVRARFSANGWRVFEVNGHDISDMRRLFASVGLMADDCQNRCPSLVIASTVIGFGNPSRAGSHRAHHGSFGSKECAETKRALGLDPSQSFEIPLSIDSLLEQMKLDKERQFDAWSEEYESWRARNHDAAECWDGLHCKSPNQPPLSLSGSHEQKTNRFGYPPSIADFCGETITSMAKTNGRLIGGSADLSMSSSSSIVGGEFLRDELGLHYAQARNIHFGVREHAAAAIINGLTLHGAFQGYFSTFLAFSDYCRPAIRMAALMKLPSIFYFTHDSVLLGPDGPTHQPIEHLWSLRLIPNVKVVRPADAMETSVAWEVATKDTGGPTIIAATTKPLPPIERQPHFDPQHIRRGGYVLVENHLARVSLCATGSEVSLAIEVMKDLHELGIESRVVSLPCLELFQSQSTQYRQQVLRDGRGIPVVIIEAGVTLPWYRFLCHGDLAIGIDEFGVSASWADVAPRFGLTSKQIIVRLRDHFGY
jgi:transketolase